MQILVDHNLRGDAELLFATMVKEGWAALLDLEFIYFEETSLTPDIDDTTIWRLAQSRGMILLTNNRNDENALAMQYQVFVQNYANNGFVAAVIGMPDYLAEGQTKEEAVANAKAALQSRLSQGEFVTIEVEEPIQKASGNPWLDSFGAFKDDPTHDDFLENIAGYRREIDEEEATKGALKRSNSQLSGKVVKMIELVERVSALERQVV